MTKWFKPLALFSALALVAAACGGDDDDDVTTEAEAADTTAADEEVTTEAEVETTAAEEPTETTAAEEPTETSAEEPTETSGAAPAGDLVPVADMDGTIVGVTDEEITLGLVTDLSGNFAPIGANLTKGNELFVQWANETQGGACGRQLVIDEVGDSGYDPANAVPEYEKLRDNVALFIQFLGTPLIEAIKDALAADGVYVVPASNDGQWNSNPNVGEPGFPYQWESYSSVSYVMENNEVTKVAILHYAGAYGEAGAAGAQAAADAAGLETIDLIVDIALQGDLAAQWAEAQSFGAELVHLVAGPSQLLAANGVLQSEVATGYAPLVTIQAPVWLKAAGVPVLAENPAAYDNVYTASFAPPFADFTGMIETLGLSEEEMLADPTVDGYTVGGWLEGMWAYAVLTNTCDNLSREAILESANSLTEVSGFGAAPDFTFVETAEGAIVASAAGDEPAAAVYQPCATDPTGLCAADPAYSAPGLIDVSLVPTAG